MKPTNSQYSPTPLPSRLGVLGGTFDPIHVGHLVIAECAIHELALSQVLFVPTRVQPQKLGRRVAPAEDRLTMVHLAVEGNGGFAVSRCEIDRNPPSYTADTLKILRQAAGTGGPGALAGGASGSTLERFDGPQLYFICGSDSLLDMHNWYQPEDILGQAVVAVARRPGYDDEGRMHGAAAKLTAKFGGKIIFFEAPRLDISSSELRDRIAGGLPIRYLVPEPVRIYITKHSLYREENPEQPANDGNSQTVRG